MYSNGVKDVNGFHFIDSNNIKNKRGSADTIPSSN